MISFAKKFLSIALALVLLVGVFPAAVSAAGGTVYFDVDGQSYAVPVGADDKINPKSADFQMMYEAAKLARTEKGYESFVFEYNDPAHPELNGQIAKNSDLFPDLAYQLKTVFINKVAPDPEPAVEYTVGVYQNGEKVGTVKTAGQLIVKADVDALITASSSATRVYTFLKDKGNANDPSVFSTKLNSNNYNVNVEVTEALPETAVLHEVKVYIGSYGNYWKSIWVKDGELPTELNKLQKKVDRFVKWQFAAESAKMQDVLNTPIKNNRDVVAIQSEIPTVTPADKHIVRVFDENNQFVANLTPIENNGYINMTELDQYKPQNVLNMVFTGWRFGKGNEDVATTKITSNRDVYPVMEAAATHTVTIKNANGIVKQIPVIHNARINSSDLNAMETTYHKTWKFTSPAALADQDVATTLIKQDCTVVEVETNKNAVVEYDVIFLEKLSDGNVVQKAKGRIQNGHVMGEMFPALDNKLPQPVRQNFVFDDWLLSDANGNILKPEKAFRWNTVFNEGRSIYLVATWTKEAPVYLHIYVNGNTKTEYETHLIENLRVGDTIDVSKIDVLDHYKNGNGRKNVTRVDGIYNMALWRDYQLDGKAKPLTGFITVEGSTNNSDLYAMVWDPTIKNSNSKPDTSNPKTGDETMIFATTAVMLVSAGALAVFFMDRKRRNG